MSFLAIKEWITSYFFLRVLEPLLSGLRFTTELWLEEFLPCVFFAEFCSGFFVLFSGLEVFLFFFGLEEFSCSSSSLAWMMASNSFHCFWKQNRLIILKTEHLMKCRCRDSKPTVRLYHEKCWSTFVKMKTSTVFLKLNQFDTSIWCWRCVIITNVDNFSWKLSDYLAFCVSNSRTIGPCRHAFY